MKFGFLCYCGASPIFDALDILLKYNFINKSDVKILTDRDCRAYEKAKEKNYMSEKIYWRDKVDFSKRACDYFSDCNFIIIHFGRIVSKELYENIFTINNHGSILPSFKGVRPLEEQYKFQSKFIGVTSHMVNGELDGGKIISQFIRPVPIKSSLEYYYKLNYLGKLYNVLLITELMYGNYIKVDLKNDDFEFIKEFKTSQFSNPCLINEYLQKEYDVLYEKEINDLWK